MIKFSRILFFGVLLFGASSSFATSPPPPGFCETDANLEVGPVCGKMTAEPPAHCPNGGGAPCEPANPITIYKTYQSCRELRNAGAKFVHMGRCTPAEEPVKHTIPVKMVFHNFHECVVKVRVASMIANGPWGLPRNSREYCRELYPNFKEND